MADPVVGTIFGTVGTTEFRFLARDPALKRTDYVKVGHPTDGWVVAQVGEITRESRTDGERLVGQAKVVGYRDARGLLQAPRTPFSAEAPLHRADDALIAQVFGLVRADGAYVGFVKGYELAVHLDINVLVQKHVAVLAKTGSGKSYVVGVLMEELIKKEVPIVVVDPHGEHASLGRPNTKRDDYRAQQRFSVKPRGYGEAVVEYSPDTKVNPHCAPLTLDGSNPEARDLVEILGGEVSSAQVGILHHAVKTLKEARRSWGFADVLEAVQASPANAKWNVVSQLERVVGLGIFKEDGTPVESLVKKGKVTVLNLKGVAPDLQDLVVARLVRRLFDARKTNKIPPFMLVVEEAHNFCPERGLGHALSGDVLRTVASEGRKFGMGLAIITQRPAKVDKNVLSQANTQIILKVTNPNDLKAIGSSVEGLTADAEEEIQRLPVGVGLVSHPKLAVPVLVEIRPRETEHGGESVDVMHWEEDKDEPEEVEEAPELTPAPPPSRPAPKPKPPKAEPEEPLVVLPAPRGREPPVVAEIRAAVSLVDEDTLGNLTRDQLERLHEELTGYLAAVEHLPPEGKAWADGLEREIKATIEDVEEALRQRRGLLGGLRDRLGR